MEPMGPTKACSRRHGHQTGHRARRQRPAWGLALVQRFTSNPGQRGGAVASTVLMKARPALKPLAAPGRARR